jgi:hypothetical protein
MNDTPIKHFSRRRLLRDSALATLLLPIFRQLDARAQQVKPKRLMLIFSPNGAMEAAGPCFGTEMSFSFHDWWKPLERHKNDGIFFSHMASTGASTVIGSEHALGHQAFSGYGAGGNVPDDAIRGETIDQLVSRRLTMASRASAVPSVVWGNVAQYNWYRSAFARGPRQYLTATTSPVNAFRDLFRDFMGPATSPATPDLQTQKTYARSKRVLEFITKDCTALRNGLGSEGMMLLESHCGALDAIEQSLMVPVTTAPLQACVKPADPAAINASWVQGEMLVDNTINTFWKLAAAAFACERTNVIAYEFGASGENVRLDDLYAVPVGNDDQFLGSNRRRHWHTLSHNSAGVTRTDAMGRFTKYCATAVANLITELKTSGVLDDTLVIWMPELGGNPNTRDPHPTSCLPVVLFGGKNSGLKLGRYIKGPCQETADNGSNAPGAKDAGSQVAQILVSAIHHMGFTDVKTVGEAQVNGPLMKLYT